MRFIQNYCSKDYCSFEDLNSFIFLTCFLYEKQTQSGSGKNMFLKI